MNCLINSLKLIHYPQGLIQLFVYIFLVLLTKSPAVAQMNPTPLPESEPLFPQQNSPNSDPEAPNLEVPRTIFVKEFEIKGSTVFTPSQLTEILAPFRDRALSYVELLEAQQAVTNLYLEQGYITSGAYIPAQSFDEGLVTIQVVEGAIEAIEIEGLDRLNASYVRSRIQLGAKPPLNQEKLLEALQLLQLDPLIDRLSAELTAGSRPGLSRLTVEVTEASAFSAALVLDNQRSPVVGTDRRLIEITHQNLFGFGDRASITYFNTDGSNSIDNLSYTIPLNPRNGTFTFRTRFTRNEIIEEPFDELDIDSDYRQYVVNYRQPIVRTPREELTLGLSADRQESDTSLLDLLEGETRVFALRFFQEYINRTSQDVFAARSEFTFGLEGSEIDLNGEESDEDFYAWRGQVQYVRRLTPDTTVLLRSELQLADRPLLSLEQFSLGGALTVRGYRQDLLVADNGFLASAEVRTPILRIPEWNTTVQLTPFFDFGTAWNRGDDPVLPRETLSSVGLGLELLVGENFVATLDWGIPLVEVDIDKDTLQENGIYFSVQYQPF